MIIFSVLCYLKLLLYSCLPFDKTLNKAGVAELDEYLGDIQNKGNTHTNTQGCVLCIEQGISNIVFPDE